MRGLKRLGVARAEIGNDTFHGHGGIDGAQFAFGGDGLGEDVEGVGLVEQGLALQVRGFNEIAIDDSEVPDAGANEKIGGGGSDCTAANDGRP